MRAYLAGRKNTRANAPGNATKLHLIAIRRAGAPEQIGFVLATAQTGLVSVGGLTWIKIPTPIVANFVIVGKSAVSEPK
ncbi:MAG: hypothetical protein AB7G08_32280 [Hyphomicrobiaceae bacterium]